MGQDNPKLRQASWRVGRGYNIPISYPAWFKFKPNAPSHLQDQITTVADLIDQQNASWKANLITQLYDKLDSDQIMSVTIPVVETNAAPDKLIWPHSLNGEYQVKKAYEILTHNDNVSGPPSTNNTPSHCVETSMENQTSTENPHFHLAYSQSYTTGQSRAQPQRSTL